MTKMNLEATARAGSVAHMLRGGRLVKRKGQVLSFAPHVGQLCSVSCGALAAGLALGVSLLGAAPAVAGTCDPLLPPPGTAVTCSGALDSANDVTVVIKGEQLTINTTPGFGVSTSAGDGLNIETTTGIEFGLIFSDNEASQITSAAATALAINAVGNTTVATNGVLVGGTYGIKATLNAVGALTLDATGSVEGETLDGINADLLGEARDITVRAATVIGGQNGIDVNNNASGNTFVGSSISVTAINGVGIIVNNQSTSTENLTIDVVNVIGKTGGISAYNNGNGTTIVSATGLVGGTAVDGYTTADGIRVFNTAIGNTAIPAGQTAVPVIGMQVSAHDVNGGVNGIFADHNGAGGLVITAGGTVNGRSAAGINANNSTDGTYLSITTATVTGGNNGVFAVNNGDGATSITANGNITGTAYNGIYVTNGSTATDVTIDTKGNTILGGDDGIQVKNNGIGATLITSTGDITGTAGDGIDVSTDASAQNIAINANNVTGGDDGIDVQNDGNGFTSVTANGLVKGGAGGNGIEVNNAATATALTVSAAAVEGVANGIYAKNLGTGATSVSASGAVNGTIEDGIYVTAAGINLTVNTTAAVIGGDDGIDAKNDGGGFTLITAIGDVEGKGTRNAIGISAVNAGTTSSLEIRANNANTVQSGGVGISAQNLGSGATSVSSTGNVIGVLFDGITALNSGTTLTINANNVTGGDDGIDAQNNGNDFTIITATGLVKGGVGGNGIEVNNAASAAALTIDAAAVTGGVNGIFAENLGTGVTIVTATGLVGGTATDGYTTADGIRVTNSALGNTAIPAGQTVAPLIGMQVSAHDVNGGVNGIFADHNGAGGLVLTADGTVNGRSADGINANNSTAGTYLSVTTAAVTGGVNGIFAKNLGTGATLVSAGGAVTGGTGDGIYADTEGTNLTISANAVTGGLNGIVARNDGSGFTLVTASGAVTGSDEDGIYVVNFIGTTDLTISANAVTGGRDGVFAENDGSGNTTITTIGVVTGTAGDGISSSSEAGSTLIIANALVTGGNYGINADSDFDGVNLTIAANAVTGGVTGIYAGNFATGATLVTASGVVKGTTGFGINAQNGVYDQNVTGGTDLTIDVETDVKGGTSGIFAVNNGTGVTLINTTGPNLLGGGTVTGYAGNGIDVLNGANAADLIIEAASVTGSLNGINAVNNGDGSYTSITATGTVTGALDGIYALNKSDTTDLKIVANVAEGAGSAGIRALNQGDGYTSVTSTGTATSGVYGIFAENGADTTDLTIVANVVTGGNQGIRASNLGIGNTTVTTNGIVSGTNASGIDVVNRSSATDLTVIAKSDVSGGDIGIEVFNQGNGATFVSASGIVTGRDDYGIFAETETLGTDLTIDVESDVKGGREGIFATNNGSGVTLINTTGANLLGGGTVTGYAGNGINVLNGTNASDLIIEAASVTGSLNGINAVNNGDGSYTSITATGTVTGQAEDGIFAANEVGTTNLTIDANVVTGDSDGIDAENEGIGSTSVTANGLVTGGASGNGIDVNNAATAGALTVSAAAVTGGLNGIFAVNNGTGASTVSVSGTIAGGSGVGIETSTLAGNLTTINVANTAVVGATSGNAIANNEGNSVLNIAANGVVNGSVELDNGNDTANFARNGALVSITRLDGGDNNSSADGFVDTLNFNGRDNANLVGARIVNWEIININGGTVGFSDAAILAETINVNNGGTLDGTNNLVATANVNIAGGGALTIGNADGTGVTRITGNLANAGIVSLRGRSATAGAGDTLNVGGNYAGAGGQIVFDTVLNGDDSLTDLLNVTGNVTGNSVIAINNAGGVGGFTTGDGILIVRVGGTSAQDGFRLLDDVQAGAFRYDLFLGGVTDPVDQDWYLRTVGLSDVAATTLSFARLSDDIAMTFLGTLHERVGEQEHLAKRGYQSGGVSGIWGRFVGKGFRDKLTSPTLGDVKSTGSITGLQMGLDFVRNVKGDGSATFAGAYTGYADGSSSDKNIFQGVSRRSGTSDSKGWLAGLYGTHYASAGWYANVVLQASWVDASANGRNGAVLKTDGRTYLSSFELGQSLKLADRLSFEPQVQLIYGDTQFDAATDSNGIESRVGIESSLIGRSGFRLKTTKSEKYNAEGGLFSGYLKANLWHNFSGADIELFSADQAIGGFEPKKTWVDVGLGTTLTVAKNTEIFFDADVEFGLDKKNTSGRGNVGLRFNW